MPFEERTYIDDPHRAVGKLIEDVAPPMLPVAEGGENGKGQEEKDDEGNESDEHEPAKVVDPAKHAIVAVQLEELHC